LKGTINVDQPNRVLLGLGMATLISTTGQPVIKVGNVDGVKVSSLLLQAGEQKTTSLLVWGEKGYAGNATSPGAIHDVFARAGGPDSQEVQTDIML
jgi:hypothetical protein